MDGGTILTKPSALVRNTFDKNVFGHILLSFTLILNPKNPAEEEIQIKRLQEMSSAQKITELFQPYKRLAIIQFLSQTTFSCSLFNNIFKRKQAGAERANLSSSWDKSLLEFSDNNHNHNFNVF